MATKTAERSSLDLLLGLYDYHTKLYLNSLEGLSDKDAANRLGTKANHIAWIAGSLVQQRFALAGAMGIEERQTSDELFAGFKGIQDNVTYPSLEEYRKDWERISPLLRDAIANADESVLDGKDPFGIPGGDYTLFDTLTFTTDRESYCIGQIGLFRRLLGHAAMKFD